MHKVHFTACAILARDGLVPDGSGLVVVSRLGCVLQVVLPTRTAAWYH
jgi:hypothetical protein